MIRAVLCLCLFAVGSAVNAQGDHQEAPRYLVGFLKPGMHVGVQHVDGTTSVILSTYSESDFDLAGQILKRGRMTSNATELAKEHKEVRSALDRYLAESDPKRSSEEGIMMMPLIRTSLGKITNIGTDYVLIELEGHPGRRVVIPLASIGKIYPDASPVRFFAPTRRARADQEP